MSLRALWIAPALLAAAANAQPPAAPPVVQDRPAAAAGHGFRAKAVLGSRISITGGPSVGLVDDIVFSDEGTVEYLVVLNEGRYVVVPWQAAKFDFDKRIGTLSVTQEQFRRVPTYTVQQWPTVKYYDPTYRTELYRYYGLTPAEQRRLDRRNP